MKKIPILFAGMLLVLGACVTFKVDEDEITKIIKLINAGDNKKLAQITQIPFLLDGEIIALQDDAGLLWQNLAQAKFTMRNAELVELVPVDKDTYKLFADTWEVDVFFKKYVPPKSMLAKLKADNGNFLLLLDGEKKGYAQILGIKGP
jgi:hypothetical protein